MNQKGLDRAPGRTREGTRKDWRGHQEGLERASEGLESESGRIRDKSGRT